jgi:hypothetical protein
MGRPDRDECVVRVGEQQHRLVYVRQYGREVAELTHQRTLLGEEGAPEPPRAP